MAVTRQTTKTEVELSKHKSERKRPSKQLRPLQMLPDDDVPHADEDAGRGDDLGDGRAEAVELARVRRVLALDRRELGPEVCCRCFGGTRRRG